MKSVLAGNVCIINIYTNQDVKGVLDANIVFIITPIAIKIRILGENIGSITPSIIIMMRRVYVVKALGL